MSIELRHRPWAVAAASVVLLAAVLAACSDDEDDPAAVKQRDAVEVGDGGVGTCLQFPDDTGPSVTKLPVIDCDQPHTHEIYFVDVRPGSDVYPGFDVLEDQARLTCLDEFERYVGRGAFDSEFLYTWIVPSIESWNDQDVKDREILCLLGARDGKPLVGKKYHANS